MRRMLPLIVAMAVAALVLAVAALSLSGAGSYSPGFNGTTVYIHNNTAGGDGSTIGNNGAYAFGGLVQGFSYAFRAAVCHNHTYYHSGSVNYTVGNPPVLPSLAMGASGTC